MDELSPDSKPAFLEPARAESIGYVGADVAPEFDAELAPVVTGDPDDNGDPGDIGPAGKGPSRGYQERWRAIARLHALGLTSNQIGRKLGYSAGGISLALQKPWVQAEVARFREAFESDVVTRVKDAAQDGVAFIHETIHNERAKVSERLDASKWAVEKATGKARQEIGVESGTLMSFMELMRHMQAERALDVTPPEARSAEGQASGSSAAAVAAPQESDKFDAWLNANLQST